jgi:YVTN family beta-propeller protein
MKAKNNALKIVSVYLLVVALNACDTNPFPEIKPTPTTLHGVFILNQGRDKQNEASLSFYDPETGNVTDIVMNNPDKPAETEPLGDLGQDMLIYGSKLYISVSNSGYIRVLHVETKQTIAKIPLKGSLDNSLNPRYMAAHDGNVYVTCWGNNSVARIDTTALAVNAFVPVGSYPEGIAACAYNNKLYVANSGAMAGNTLSVIDVPTFTVEREITVGLNPNLVKAGREGYIYLNFLGNYFDIPGGFQRIDLPGNEVTTLGHRPKGDFIWDEKTIYYYDVTYGLSGAPETSYGKFATSDYATHTPLITDNTTLSVPFAIGLDPVGKNIYLADAMDFSNPGKVYIFDTQGKLIHDFSAGVIPCKFAFY